MLMSLGGFEFKIDTAAFQNLRRATQYRWPSQARFNQRPARQFVGPGDDTINLSGTVYPGEHSRYAVSHNVLDGLRERAERGQPLSMCSGQGTVLGRWVIVSLNETRTLFFGDGTARKIEFTVSLAHYGDDQLAAG